MRVVHFVQWISSLTTCGFSRVWVGSALVKCNQNLEPPKEIPKTLAKPPTSFHGESSSTRTYLSLSLSQPQSMFITVGFLILFSFLFLYFFFSLNDGFCHFWRFPVDGLNNLWELLLRCWEWYRLVSSFYWNQDKQMRKCVVSFV